MAAVSYPTVFLGVGRFGAEVVDRTLRMFDEDLPLVRSIVGEPDEIPERLGEVLEQLLRVAKASTERKEPRLDLVAFASGLQVGDGALLRFCDRLAKLIGERYAPMFPADRPPEQRTAALHLIVAVPHLTSPAGTQALQQLSQVETWIEGRPSFPLLARIWLISQQSTAGTLTKTEIDASCAGFASALCGSGLRTEDIVSRRLAHPRSGEGRIAFFSVASVDLPSAFLRRYASMRCELDGLNELVERVGTSVPDPTAGLTAVSTLGHEQWLTELAEGQSAQRVRGLAAELSGGGRSLPSARVGPFDTAEDIRASHAALFAPAAVHRPLTREDQARLDEVLTGLDRAEAGAASDVERGVRTVLDTVLGASTGLRRLPEVETGLRRVSAMLEDSQATDAKAQAEVERDLTPSLKDPHREELERAAAELPTRGVVIATGAALALGVAFAASMGILDILSGSSAGAGAAATTQDFVPWVAGAILGLVAGCGWAWFAGRRSRASLQSALEVRREALVALWSRGGGGPPQRQAEMQLLLRRQRVRRHALRALEVALARLHFLRRTLGGARDRARGELLAMQVSLGTEASLDNLAVPLGGGSELHGSLLAPSKVARWVARSREVIEPTVWGDRLLQATWPSEGLSQDVPCADPAQLDALSEANVKPLSQRSIFENEELVAEAAQELVERARLAATVLAPACEPCGEHGDKVAAAVQGQFAVAPIGGRQAFEPALQAAGNNAERLWTEGATPRVLFVATWEGYTVKDVIRGAGKALGRKDAAAS